MTPTFVAKRGFVTWKTDISVQKIDSLLFVTYEIVFLNLTSAYHRMRIREGDKWKTVFCIRYGHLKYQVMPCGLSNTPASFQGYINKILVEKLDIFIKVYLGNILIYTEETS